MDDKNVGQLQRNAAAIVFDNAHCKNKGLPDFFGYSIRHNLLVEWAQQQWKICLVVFDCKKKKGSEKMVKDLPVWVKLPNAKAVLDLKPEKVWRIFQNYAEKPNCCGVVARHHWHTHWLLDRFAQPIAHCRPVGQVRVSRSWPVELALQTSGAVMASPLSLWPKRSPNPNSIDSNCIRLPSRRPIATLTSSKLQMLVSALLAAF